MIKIADCKMCELIQANQIDVTAGMKHQAEEHPKEWNSYVLAGVVQDLAKAESALVMAFNGMFRQNAINEDRHQSEINEMIDKVRNWRQTYSVGIPA
jgi:hypothetical protein